MLVHRQNNQTDSQDSTYPYTRLTRSVAREQMQNKKKKREEKRAKQRVVCFAEIFNSLYLPKNDEMSADLQDICRKWVLDLESVD